MQLQTLWPSQRDTLHRGSSQGLARKVQQNRNKRYLFPASLDLPSIPASQKHETFSTCYNRLTHKRNRFLLSSLWVTSRAPSQSGKRTLQPLPLESIWGTTKPFSLLLLRTMTSLLTLLIASSMRMSHSSTSQLLMEAPWNIGSRLALS